MPFDLEELAAHEVMIKAGKARLAGHLSLPAEASAIVVFAHGSGSSRFSPRNQQVAARLQKAGFATLLFDLLTAEEDSVDRVSRAYRYDIALLAERLIAATDWLKKQRETAALKIGYFGASTGAAAALIAAAQRGDRVGAVVSRGGRPDLADTFLPEVITPTLLIIGELDTEVIQLNEQAKAMIGGKCQLEIVPGASHLFEEGNTLERAAELASRWFQMHLQP